MKTAAALLTVASVLGGAMPALAADPATPKTTSPRTPAPGGPIPVPYPVTPRAAPAAPAPVVSGYAPARVLAGASVSVRGSSFGDGAGRQMRVAGEGENRALVADHWSPTEVRVRLPADIRPGRYYIAVADPAGRWLSNLERTLEVAEPLRRVPVRLDVTFGCEFDVVTASNAVGIRLERAGGGAPITVSLRSAGSRDGPQGSKVYGYEGQLEALAGGYRIAATESVFTAGHWDYINGNARPVPGGGVYIERTNWEDCHAHRRVTSWGARLPGPERQDYRVRLGRERLEFTVDLNTVRLEGHPARGAAFGGLPTPTPVDIR